ncbi:hypothetical protein DH2020_046534 [Rehmannia glutinosa]|uniref:Uncharacterized protein n=1 Tax=Rehmannia glutinosa TaxID=99300 RepID=A0ABR0UBY4_REHGL
MGDKFEYAIRFEFLTTNNKAEYEALVDGMKLALAAGARSLVVHSDSQLVVNQMEGTYEAKDEKMNSAADHLAKLASSIAGVKSRKIIFLSSNKSEVDGEGLQILCTEDEEPSWKDEIVKYLTSGELPVSPNDAQKVKIWASRFLIIDGELYKKGYSQPYLKCLTPDKANYVMREIHEGICGNHLGGKVLAAKALRQGYFWPTMQEDVKKLVRRCHSCQEHINIHCQPVALMQTLESPYPFAQWGIDLVGSFPPATGQRKFMITVVDYFTKWVKAEPLAKIMEKAWKIHKQTDKSKLPTAPSYNILRQGWTTKGLWVDELPSVLWAYRTTPRTSTGESPFNLTYGSEVIAPTEIGEMSQRVRQYNVEHNDTGLRANLDLLDELREKATTRAQMFRTRLERSYNRKVQQRSFQVGDLVLRKADITRQLGKLDPKWEGPYKIEEVVNPGAYCL